MLATPKGALVVQGGGTRFTPAKAAVGPAPDNGGKGLSMTATFRGHEGRHLVVYGDAKVPGRFVGVSVVVDRVSGGVEGVEMMMSAL